MCFRSDRDNNTIDVDQEVLRFQLHPQNWLWGSEFPELSTKLFIFKHFHW